MIPDSTIKVIPVKYPKIPFVYFKDLSSIYNYLPLGYKRNLEYEAMKNDADKGTPKRAIEIPIDAVFNNSWLQYKDKHFKINNSHFY